MRQILLASLLAAACWAGPPIQQISATRFVGESRGIEPVAAGDAFLPALLAQRSDPRGHFRVVDLGLDNVDQAKLKGDAVAIGRYGGGVVLATAREGELSFLELRYEGRRMRGIEHGSFGVADLQDWRVLHLGAGDGHPLMVVSYRAGLIVVRVGADSRRTALFARPQGRVLAASGVVRTREGNTIFAIDSQMHLLELREQRGAWVLAREVALRADGFTPRALAASSGQIWIGGTAQGRGQLLFLAPDALKERRVPRHIPKEVAGAFRQPVEPASVLQFARGTIDHVQFLGAEALALGGVKDGRPWVGVGWGRARFALQHEGYPAGARIVALGVNPARKGWSLAVGMDDMYVRLMRIPGDEGLPRDWDPFAVPEEPEEVPEPAHRPHPHPRPQPDPVPVPAPADPGHGHEGPVGLLTTAVLPRVACDRRRGEDTEIVLVYLGRAPARVRVGLVADTGRALHAVTAVLQPGQKLVVSTAGELAKLGVPSFVGYARVDGVARRDLVVEGFATGGGPARAGREVLPAHWR